MNAHHSAGELNLEQFVQFAREVVGITTSKMADEALARVFVRVDETGNGTIDEDTLKR